ncbi:hypothetical protein CANARDRAFT_210794 [[Candida] arabinofermentans NRRL YB-2248]|uniref:Protein YIP n=1 Tax=[Candida] arabinofermentans NRRL YB-2248 TaxID=983967 RepID=A0A1E4T6E0_9ASCO|nr:hypothetical protein CANARDRAFT_210794 [[Candida] arabinofermentans NRRL YB-2248]
MSYSHINDQSQFDIDDDDIIIQPDDSSSSKQPQSQSQPQKTTTTPSSSSSIKPPKTKKQYSGGLFTLNYYRKYFDLTTNEFFKNILKSLNPISKINDENEFTEIGDLYGSIWITATLIFLLFFCNSLSELISEFKKHTDQPPPINHFKLILISINLLYGYIIIIPLLIFIILKFYFKLILIISLTKIISIYSYANIMWIPATLLSIFRGLLINHKKLDLILKWICISLGFILSGSSIILKLMQYFKIAFNESDLKKSYLLLIVLILCHFGFSLAVKVAFFGDL